MKILVLGAGGMAGHVVAQYMRDKGHQVDTLSASHPFDERTKLVDVTNHDKLVTTMESSTYDSVINCVALLVVQSEENKDLAVYLNAYLPHFLESYYANKPTKVLHISTDDVFSFEHPPYMESSPYDGQSFYGRSKALGELTNNKDVTFRTSIIGPAMRRNGGGLFDWFSQQTGKISGFTNVIWNGVTTIELAKAMLYALEQDLSGIHHLVPDKPISKYELLEVLKEVFGRQDLIINLAEGKSANKVLIRSREDFDYQVPTYEVMVREMKTWIKNHPKIYRHYEVN